MGLLCLNQQRVRRWERRKVSAASVGRRVAKAFRLMTNVRTIGMTNPAENKPIGFPCGAGDERNTFSAEEYWTEERRAKAEPVPMPKPRGGEQPTTTG